MILDHGKRGSGAILWLVWVGKPHMEVHDEISKVINRKSDFSNKGEETI